MKAYIKYIILILVFISSIIFINYNADMYENPIMKVTSIKINTIDYQYNNNLKEKYYHETVYGTIINGKDKNLNVSFDNIHSNSGVYDDKYNVGDEIFVHLEDNSVSETISLRRDKFLVPLFTLMLCLLILIGGNKGLFTIISLIFNIGIVIGVISLRDKGGNIFWLFVPAAIIMSFVSLLLTSGFNKKTKVAILSTGLSLFITFMISCLIIIIFNREVPYWYMEYVDILYDYKEVFLVSVLISGLGAIMDIAISIVSTMNELIVNAPKISVKSLKKSSDNLSDDILGTMINVLLFTGLSSTFPILLFVMRNDITIITAINMYAKIELIRIMTGWIGILITIPVSKQLSIYFFKRRGK